MKPVWPCTKIFDFKKFHKADFTLKITLPEGVPA